MAPECRPGSVVGHSIKADLKPVEMGMGHLSGGRNSLFLEESKHKFSV